MTRYNHSICDFVYEGEMGNVYNKIKRAAKKADLKIVGEAIHYYNPCGISIIFILAESHLSIHTWEEEQKINIDVFACESNNTNENKSLQCINYFLDEFKVIKKNIQTIIRE